MLGDRLVRLLAPAAFVFAALLARAAGFSAISDDDFARVTLAQTFAHAPRLDPTGSSWLPFPFWLEGGLFLLTGRSLLAAQGIAIVFAGFAGLLLERTAALLDATPKARLATVGLALWVPIAPFLAAATVPELPTAALACFGVAALALGERRVAFVGAVCLLAATWSRYEVWPMAMVAGALGLRRARSEGAIFVGLSALATFGPLAWLGWNAHAHGDALWFLRRVAAFRAHAGGGPSVLLGYPLALVRDGAAIGVAALIGFGVRPPLGRSPSAGSWSLLMAAAASFTFLLLGDVLGGAPTHHPERALLPAFFGLVLATVPRSELFVRSKTAPLVFLAACGVFALRTPGLLASFVDRREALAEGRALSALVPVGERVIVARDTYATEASRAAFERAEDFFPVVSHSFDARSSEEPLASPGALRLAAKNRGARYVVVDVAEADKALAVGEQVARWPTTVVVKLHD